jgi:TolA-binding protein
MLFSRFPALLLPLLALAPAAVHGQGQGPLVPAVPLVAAGEATAVASEASRTLAAAQQAQELGLPSVAVGHYRRLLAAPDLSASDRAAVGLALVTALLDGGEIADAEQTLQQLPVPARGSAWHLRAGLIAAYEKRVDAAKTELAAVRREELAADDVSWWFFLQAMIANLENDPRSLDLYGQAVANAPSEMARARFLLSQDLARLTLGRVLQSDLDNARKNLESTQGKGIGYSVARGYAMMLDAFGQKSPAVDVLTRQLRTLLPGEAAEGDNLRLLLGLIAGAGDPTGRGALTQLLATGTDAEKQRIALQLLARTARDGAAKADFLRQLNELIAAPRPHRILDDLLVIRAQIALNDTNYAQAETDAKAVLEKFPGSHLKPQALGILTSAAWERGYYRNAADYAAKARDELRGPADRQIRARLGLLIAEAYFRAEDYRNAAEAYKAVLNERPDGVAPGALMFQRVLAEIRAANFDGQQLAAVETLLDELARDPAFDPVNRWQSEWNFAQALLAAGKTEAAKKTEAGTAFARINRLLDTAPAGSGALPPELRVRMEWLRARLALETGQPEQTLRYAEDLGRPREGVSLSLQAEIGSSAALLRAQADFALGREQAAAEVLKKLREDFHDLDAAIKSYVIEANYNAGQDRTAVAQQLLNKLADDFPKSTYAPYALYQVALLESQRGQEANLKEANNRFEKLITTYPQSEFVFDARFEQGQLLRRLNEFPPAQQTYEAILNAFPQHAGLDAVRLALADTHAAQAAGAESHADRAKEGYDRLLALRTAPLDLRVEAGFKLGNLLLQYPDTRRAEDIWWRDVVNQFLFDPRLAVELGPNGRYWMSRTLLELGDLFIKQGHPEEARRVWNIVLQKALPNQTEANEKLGQKPGTPL